MSLEIFIKEQETEAPFTLNDRVFIGEAIVETLKFTRNGPSYPKLHWQRIRKAANFLEVPCSLSFESWLESLKRCIDSTKLQEGGIRVVLGGGQAQRGLLARSQKQSMIFTGFACQPQHSSIRLISSSWRRDAANPIYQIKSTNYLEAIIARRQAAAVGADDVLFFNFEDNVTETTIANVFIIKNNCLLTPSQSNGVLPGVIRQRLLELGKKEEISILEGNISRKQIMEAEAVFTCNALQGVRAVQYIDKQAFDPSHSLISKLQLLLARDLMTCNY